METKLTEVSSTLLKGRITEVYVLAYFLNLGYIVSTPEVPCQYDMLIDVNNKIYKVQIKTCREVEGAIEFNTASMTHNANGYVRRDYTADKVDFFCTYYNNECYLVPFNECGSKAKKLRLIPTKNGQVKNISFAKDYIAKDILAKLI